MKRILALFFWVLAIFGAAQDFRPFVPQAWDEPEAASFELPPAQADRSPRYPLPKDYYSFDIRPVYRTYPSYHPGREPVGDWDSLQRKDPEIVFEPARLVTKADWISAGELVFDAPTIFLRPTLRERQFAEVRAIAYPADREGVIP